MRVSVDLELCQGHAMCELWVPDVFTVPKRGKVTILDEHPPADLHERVGWAVRECPTQALRLGSDHDKDQDNG